MNDSQDPLAAFGEEGYTQHLRRLAAQVSAADDRAQLLPGTSLLLRLIALWGRLAQEDRLTLVLTATSLAGGDPSLAEPGFTCPRCGRTSHHPRDIAQGYCGACHAWIGGEKRPRRLAEQPQSDRETGPAWEGRAG